MIPRADAALALDSLGFVVEASWAYELAIQEPAANETLFLNLAAIYFECSDIGFAAAHHLHATFVSTTAARFTEVLTLAEARFGRTAEQEFWRRYFDYIYLGGPEFVEECLRLTQNSASLVPYAYLVAFDERFRPEAPACLKKFILQTRQRSVT